jgi:excinuclease ABC subunit A
MKEKTTSSKKINNQEPACIEISNAKEHNLKNLYVKIPRGDLTVVTGVSGSGKSSLAFDTLYAEGYRQYMESLGIRSRQFLEQMKRPEVDYIRGLSPVIAIEQRGTSTDNPRSTVSSVTEISDYASLLWAFAGKDHCPKDRSLIARQTVDECLRTLLSQPLGTKITLLAPLEPAKASAIREQLPELLTKGYQKVRIDEKIYALDEPKFLLPRTGELSFDLIIDQITFKGTNQKSRLADALELAWRESKGRAVALIEDPFTGKATSLFMSQELACMTCGSVYSGLTPRHFSPNSPEGACERCSGLGEQLRFMPELVVPDQTKSIRNGAIKAWRFGSMSMIVIRNSILKQLAQQWPFDPTIPWKDLPKDVQKGILHGTGDKLWHLRFGRSSSSHGERTFEGVLADLDKSFCETSSPGLRARLMTFQTSSACSACAGDRLSARSRSVTLGGLSIVDFYRFSIEQAHSWITDLQKSNPNLSAFSEAIEGLKARLGYLEEVGLNYLTLNRTFCTLSGGEAQRVRLASQLGLGLTGVTYILDEPSIGLHVKDQGRLINCLKKLKERGNTLVVVEHDPQIMQAADHIIELGPTAGRLGGQIMFTGTAQECLKSKTSRTGLYLSGRLSVSQARGPKSPDGHYLKIIGATQNNLKNIDVEIPIGLVTCVCGVSGSGKSSLINDILGRAAAFKLNRAKEIPGAHRAIEGLEQFKKVVRVDQDPIRATTRSNPATFVKAFDVLREIFSQCPLARVRGYAPGRFSFNTRGGRCERCQGEGEIRMDMHFLQDVYVECPSCNGHRYNRETLEVKYKGLSIAEVLELTIDDACEIFNNHPKLVQKLKTLCAVGLGYLKLGQPGHTLSGGETQRIKLSLELSKSSARGTNLYILDEPTVGLHWDDVQKLLDVIFELRDAGHTIIMIEHEVDCLRLADWIIELGPSGGGQGGNVVYTGIPRKNS